MNSSEDGKPVKKIPQTILTSIKLIIRDQEIEQISIRQFKLSAERNKQFMKIKSRGILTFARYQERREEFKPVKKFCSSCGVLLTSIIRCAKCGNSQ